MLGNLDLVTAIGYGSISEAMTGSIPQSEAANGNPPEPSKRESNLLIFPHAFPFIHCFHPFGRVLHVHHHLHQ